jgi:uncharacterized membrane protein (DUF485 family)
VPFDSNGSGLDKCVPVVAVRFPVSSVSVPIAFVVAVPIFVIPIVVTAVLVSSGWKRAPNNYAESEDR